MAYSSLALGNDKYELFLSNEEQEYQRNPEEHSTASDFRSILDPGLDISTLVFLKSSEAELAVQNIYIDNFPVSFSQTEAVSIYVAIPLLSATCNQNYNKYDTNLFNNEPFAIPFQDVTASRVEEIVDYLNNAICEKLTFFLLKSYCRLVLDIDVFQENATSIPTKDELKLAIRYVEIALFSRHILHKYLCAKLDETNDNIDNLITFTIPTSQQTNMTSTWEESIINESSCFKPVASRTHTVEKNARLINLEDFSGVSLRAEYDTAESVRANIESNMQTTLEDVMQIEYTLLRSLTNASVESIKKFIGANKDLISLGLKTREILILNLNRFDKRTNVSKLFADFLITFKLDTDNSKLKVEMNPRLFLTDTSTIIVFPKQASYVIGGKNNENVTIGPITHNSDSDKTEPMLTQNITNTNHRLFSRIRPFPRVIHFLSDVVGGLSRDGWLAGTQHSDYTIFHTMMINEEMINTRYICKVDQEQTFHRTSNARRVLNGLRFRIIDDNFRLIHFPVCTVIRMSFVIRPVLHENASW